MKAYGVKFSPDGASAALSVAIRRDEGPAYVELARVFDPSDGLGDVAEWLGTRQDEAAVAVIDGQGGAQTLHDRLRDVYDVPRDWVVRPTVADATSAYFAIANAVEEGTLEHFGQEPLDDSATKCTKRRIGTKGGWGFESTDEADACLVESAALAHWGAVTTKRDQRKELLVGW